MKKNIILIFSALFLILSVIFFRVNISSEHSLAGEKVSDGLYYYDLDLNNEILGDFLVKDNTIYYYTWNDTGDTNYWKLDLLTNQKENIASIPSSTYCYFSTDYLSCNNYDESVVTIYDLNYQQVYNEIITNGIESYLEYAPYKDTFLKILDNDIYINQQGDDIKTRELTKIKELRESSYYSDYYNTPDNTYLLFYNYDSEENILYDYNNDTYTAYAYGLVSKYENGFIITTEEEYIIIDLKNTKTYKYSCIDNYGFYAIALKSDNSTLFTYDNSNILKVEDLFNETIKELDFEALKNSSILSLQVNDSYLSIQTNDEQDSYIYILDLTYIGEINELKTDYLNRQENEVINKKEELENTYGITIHIKDSAVADFPDFTAEALLNNYTISYALDEISTVLAKYNPEFFKEFTYSDYNGLQIYLTGTLRPNDYDNQISNPAGYSLIFNDYFTIAIDGEQIDLKTIFCHELFHNIENRLDLNDTAFFLDWDTYNPIDFSYNYSYTLPTSDKYTIYSAEDDYESIYFIREYGYTFPSEDRADIFGAICSCSEDSEINNYPNLYKKGIYLREEILRGYPELQYTTLFESLH